ncbi:MAG TPA: glycoside hydrolase domain-containing protein, partial [Anaeromyxobacteraceae bacterium]|nr:glycoside hydrolase domain-containing protein [Anaeromyxobacteraceae bacterium]
VRPMTAARSTTRADIAAARNEFEAFQVVVTGPASKVSARASALEGPGRIEGVRLFREDLIDVKQLSALDGELGLWPDALVPDVDDVVGEKRNAFPFDVKDGESRAIWAEVHVPADAKPGTYTGTVTIESAEGVAEIPVTLTVWDFELPSTSSMRTSFILSYGTTRAAHRKDGDEESALRARYGQLGLDHRISLTSLADDGRHNDLDNVAKFYGPLLDGTAPTTLEGAKLTTFKYVGDRTSVPEHARWAEYFRSRGWFDRLYDYTCDEPPLTCTWDEIKVRAKAVHDADPEFQTLVTTHVQLADEKGVRDSIDIMVPVINFMDDRPGQELAGDQTAAYGSFLAQGGQKELWTYQSCMSHGCGGTVNFGNPSASDHYYTGWPTYMIDSSAVRSRAQEWLSFLHGATGELYWETTMAYTHDAWSNQWDFSGNGDGTLFYPGLPSRIGGQTDIPVASIRLKMIREGMEDYEYLKLLADSGDAELAKRLAREVFPNAYSTDIDPTVLMNARAQLAKRIVELRGGTVVTAPEGAAPAGPAAPGGSEAVSTTGWTGAQPPSSARRAGR